MIDYIDIATVIRSSVCMKSSYISSISCWCQANEKLNAAKKAVNVIEQEKLIADALDVSLSFLLVAVMQLCFAITNTTSILAVHVTKI